MKPKKPKCLSSDEWINIIWCIHTMKQIVLLTTIYCYLWRQGWWWIRSEITQELHLRQLHDLTFIWILTMLTKWKMGANDGLHRPKEYGGGRTRDHDFPTLLNSKVYDAGVVHRIQSYVRRSNVLLHSRVGDWKQS